jgi:hypothetical protein
LPARPMHTANAIIAILFFILFNLQLYFYHFYVTNM